VTLSQELRYSEDRISETSQPRAATAATGFGATFKRWLPRTILQLQLDRDVMAYGSVARGNKPGGFNNAAGSGFAPVPDNLKSYGEEQMWVYEIGFKSAWFDRRLTLNGAVFLIDWSNIQVNSQVVVNGLPVGYTTNAGAARGAGFESELRFQPDKHWDIYGSVGYAPIRIENYVDSRIRNAGIVTDGSDQIAGTPDWTGSFGTLYTLALTDKLNGFLQGDLTYRSTTYATEANLEETGAKTVVDLQAGVTTGKIRATVYVNNVFDNKVIDSARAFVNPTTFARAFIVQLPNPRQFGVRFIVKY
jgi:iron complex outermembrane receptor protein